MSGVPSPLLAHCVRGPSDSHTSAMRELRTCFQVIIDAMAALGDEPPDWLAISEGIPGRVRESRSRLLSETLAIDVGELWIRLQSHDSPLSRDPVAWVTCVVDALLI